MVYSQIHAPATLPNYVHMHLMNSKFLASLYSPKPRLFLCKATDTFRFVLKGLLFTQYTFQYEASFTLQSIAVPGITFVTACFVLEFSGCVLHSIPLSPTRNYVIW